MRLTCWVAEATTGNVIAKLNEVILTKMTKTLKGGELAGHTFVEGRRDDLDWPALIADRALLAPWERTIVITGERTTPDGEVITGADAGAGRVRSLISEWVIDTRTRASDTTGTSFTGIGWEEYLSTVAQPMPQVYDHINPLIPAADLFRAGFASAAVTVTDAPSPIRGGIDREAWSGTIGDAIAELQTQGGGWEWVIDLVPVWDGERLARVDRMLGWGLPEVTRTDAYELDAGGWDPPRAGNCVIRQTEDAARWARLVAGVAAGEGDKQIIATSTPNSRPSQRLDRTVAIDLTNVTTQAAAQNAADRRAWEMRSMEGPLEVEVSLEGGQFLPRIGARPRLFAYRSPAWPSNDGSVPVIDTTVRIGGIEFLVDGFPVVERARLKVA